MGPLDLKINKEEEEEKSNYFTRNYKNKSIGKELVPLVKPIVDSLGSAYTDTMRDARRGLLGPHSFVGAHAINLAGKVIPDIPIDKGIKHALHEWGGIDPYLSGVAGQGAEIALTRKVLKKVSNLKPKDLGITTKIEKIKTLPRGKKMWNITDDIHEIIVKANPKYIRKASELYKHHEGGITWKEAMKMAKLPSWENRTVYIPPNERIGTQKGDPLQSTDNNEFHQLVMSLDQEGPVNYNLPSNKPIPYITQEKDLGSDGNKLEGLTTQEIQSLGPAVKSYMKKRAYKDAATTEGYTRMTQEVNKTFEQLLGPNFDQDLVRGYMKAVADHEGALLEFQKILNDTTGKLWDRQHATALRNLEHSGRMLGNKGLFPAFNFPDVLDQTALGKPKVKIEREGNRPDPTARGADFQKTLSRVLGKPLSLEESILYWYDQDMFYFWKELSPLQRQQLVDSSRTRSGGRLKSELTVAENINKALESMQFGKETMSGQIGRKLTPQERLQSLVDNATANLLRTRKYKGLDKNSPLQGNVFYDIKTGKETDYRPDLTGKGAYWDIESE